MPKRPPDLLARLAEKGARLREVRRDLLRQRPGATQRWYQGPDGCDLFLWYDDVNGLHQVQLTVEQRALEWSLATGLRTARLLAFNPLTPEVDRGRLQYDREPDPEAQALARALLRDAPVDDITLALVRRHLGLREG